MPIMTARNDLVGKVFGRLRVVRAAGLNAKQNVMWECRCSCGSLRKVLAPAYDLRGGKVKSCGCLVREGAPRTHGHAGKGAKRSATYSVWAAMRQRCENPNDKNYSQYGGRGITVARRWGRFENFLADMGPAPKGLTLERKRNDRGYSPGNCEWATRKAQNRNTRSTVWVVVNGSAMCFTDAARMLGIEQAHLQYYRRLAGGDHQKGIALWLARQKAL